MRDLRGDALAHVWMEHPFAHQCVHCCALPERARQAEIRPLEQWRLSCLVKGEQPAHLRVQTLIGKRVGRELVAQEAADDPFGEDDGIQRHDGLRSLPFPVSVI
jgi:hypothetical protein